LLRGEKYKKVKKDKEKTKRRKEKVKKKMEKSIFSDTNAICVAGNFFEILEIVCKN